MQRFLWKEEQWAPILACRNLYPHQAIDARIMDRARPFPCCYQMSPTNSLHSSLKLTSLSVVLNSSLPNVRLFLRLYSSSYAESKAVLKQADCGIIGGDDDRVRKATNCAGNQLELSSDHIGRRGFVACAVPYH